MGLFDSILSQVSDNPTGKNMAEKMGIDPADAAKAVAALAEAHGQDGDTVQAAAAKTGMNADTLNSIRDHIGDEGSLGKFAAMIDKDGDGNPLNELGDMAKGFFGKK
ncbi:MAG: hypothetical protein WA948_02650 [Pontixanthobacter sp.]